MFHTLKIEIINGPNDGLIIPITCIGESNLQYRIEEVSGIQHVRIACVEIDHQLSDAMRSFLVDHEIKYDL